MPFVPPVIEKKLTEEEILIRKFKESHPQYVSHAYKIKYPIEDELLDENPWMLEKAVPVVRPEPSTTNHIGAYNLKHVMKITTFFERFDELLQGPSFTKEELSIAVNYQGQKIIDLIHDIHVALLYVFIDEFEEGSKFEYLKEYGVIFYLIKHLKDDFLELHFR